MKHLSCAGLLCALILISISCRANPQSVAKEAAIPNTLAGQKFSGWLTAFNSGDPKQLNDFITTNFAASALNQIPARNRAIQDFLIYRENHGVEVKQVVESNDYQIVVLAQSKLMRLWLRISLQVEQPAPNGISDLAIRVTSSPSNIALQPVPVVADTVAELGRFVQSLSDAGVFSGVVLLDHDGSSIFERAYGQADKSNRQPNRLDTKFNLASMNKMFTAVAIAQLAQSGKLMFSDRVGQYLTNYPNREVAERVTIDQLLTHTSGLGSYWNDHYQAGKDSIKTLSDFLPFFAGEPLLFEPGARFEYSNSGYIVLGLIIEKVSGQNYYDYIRDHICKPAGMRDTAFYETDQNISNLAIGYTNADQNGEPSIGERKSNRPLLGRRGGSAGGGYSTAPDLLKFSQALTSHKLLNPEYTKLILTGKVQRDELTKYAYGFEERSFNGERVVGHSGGFPGVAAQLEIYLDSGYTVVVLGNLDTLGTFAITAKIRELVAARSADTESSAFERKIDVGGYALQLSCSAQSNGPTIILEAGLNQGSETWNKVKPEVAKFARVCSYDRAGLGHSDPSIDTKPRTTTEMVNDLHALLSRAGIVGPLVLVGHSFGGINVRMYSILYPKDVVGIVLVDSVHEDETRKWSALLPDEVRKQLEAAGGNQPLGGEAVDLQTSMDQMRAARWQVDIPLVVLSRGTASFNPNDYAPLLRPFALQGEELRIELQKELASRSKHGKFIFAEKSGHFIQQDQPELVVSTIREVIENKKGGKV